MKNKDKITAFYSQFAQDFKAAMESKDSDAMAKAFRSYAENIQSSLLDAAQEIHQTADAAVLAGRGIRTLTGAEQKFYNDFITAATAADPKQTLTGLEKTIPQTVIDTVIADMQNAHPLLGALDVVNTYGSVKWIMAEDKKQLAQWGKLTTAIVTALDGTIKDIEFGSQKLTAYIPVPKDLLKLGASYIDAYVRIILSDASACGLEYGAIKGTGKDMPIGMKKDLDGAVVAGVYSDKAAVSVNSFDVPTYMSLVAMLARKPAATGESVGRPRVITNVALIVNPIDYLTKVIPATTVLNTEGNYKHDIFPFPTAVFPTEMLDEGEAILGVMEGGKIKYSLFLSTGTSGNIEYSDEYQFLEDNRVYAVKLLGTGRPHDNNCFVPIDISDLQPLAVNVAVSRIDTPVSTIEVDSQLLGARLNKSTVAADNTATVSVIATDFNVVPGTAPTIAYLWQVRAKTGTTWTDLTSSYTGYNTANLTVKAADAEKHYRCKVTASGTATGTVYTAECDVEAAQAG